MKRVPYIERLPLHGGHNKGSLAVLRAYCTVDSIKQRTEIHGLSNKFVLQLDHREGCPIHKWSCSSSLAICCRSYKVV